MRYRNITVIVLAILSGFLNFTGLIAQAGDGDTFSQKEASERFVTEMFPALTPHLNALWLSKALRTGLSDILGHPPQSLRIKYHQETNQTLWIFDEIGKVKPITIGVFIRAGQIAAIRVLKFRESRGWEIKYSFFTDQFQHLGLTEQMRLTGAIDGITGATLSVSAMKRVARAALYLDHTIADTGNLKPVETSAHQTRKNL